MKRILILFLAAIVVSCGTSTPEEPKLTLAEFEAYSLPKPTLDTVEVSSNEAAVQALAEARLAQYQKSVDFGKDSLLAPVGFFQKYFQVAVGADDYAEAIQSLDAYQKAYGKFYHRPGAEGMSEHVRVYAQMMQEASKTGLDPAELLPGAFQEVKDALAPIPQWYMYGYFQDRNLDTYAEKLAEALRTAAKVSADSLKGSEVDALLAAYADHKVYEQLLPQGEALAEQAKNADYTIDKNVRVPLPDGTQLAGLSVFPKTLDGPVPTVLVINCYPDSGRDLNYLQMAAAKGFAAVMVYNRGMGGGDGTFVPFEDDAEDNYHVIDWVSKQPWSDGQVGMMGGSYLGFTQWASLKNPHPALKTIVPMVSVGIGIDYPMQNNVFMYYMLQWIQFVTNDPYTDLKKFTTWDYWTDLYGVHYEQGSSFRELDVLEGKANPIFQRWLDHPGFDAYWQDMTVSSPEDFAAIDIPILSVTGYYDDDQLGALHYYRMHQAYGNAEAVKNHHLVMGPWTHGGAAYSQSRSVAGLHLPAEGSVDVPDLAYQWFDYIMRDGPKPSLLKDRVNLYVMDEGWQHLPNTSVMQDSLTVFPQPQEVGTLGSLAYQQGAGTVVLRETFAPNDFDDDSFASTLYADTAFLPTALQDGLVWESEPLAQDYVFSGAPVAQVTLTPNVKDADLIVTWYEVTTDNQVIRLSLDRERLSYVADNTTRQLLTPGEPVTFILKDSFWMGRKIAAGSRLRVMVNVGSSHEYQKNYGSGNSVSEETQADFIPIELTFDLGKTRFAFPLAPQPGA
ncbi:MAG: CocE/NonD family hydrolase [Bacteroidota bacterium]